MKFGNVAEIINCQGQVRKNRPVQQERWKGRKQQILHEKAVIIYVDTFFTSVCPISACTLLIAPTKKLYWYPLLFLFEAATSTSETGRSIYSKMQIYGVACRTSPRQAPGDLPSLPSWGSKPKGVAERNRLKSFGPVGPSFGNLNTWFQKKQIEENR